MIKAEIVADSLSPQGDRLISVLCTFPRIILAEVNTHRMLSKNTSSSRAIPFHKMVKAVQENPFIPIAFQKHHTGMQGNEYLDVNKKYTFEEISNILHSNLVSSFKNKDGKWDEDYLQIDETLNKYVLPILTSSKEGLTIVEWWLKTRDLIVASAVLLYSFGVTKQLCNRLLEPFMWTTMLITGSKEGWDNFFNLRCPQYEIDIHQIKTGEGIFFEKTKVFKSKKDIEKEGIDMIKKYSDFEWLSKFNKGQAEIHMMALAESIYDAYNESEPRLLFSGQWHIPFEDKICELNITLTNEDLVKISTAMAAHTSYTVVGGEAVKSYEKWIELHDKLIAYDPPHSSPMEHCARAMSEIEYTSSKSTGYTRKGKDQYGWCNNFKGFIPYRYMIDNKTNIE